MPITAHIGIGANLGDAYATVKAAITCLAQLPSTQLSAQSSLYSSAPIDSSGDDYINAVVQLETDLGALDLLTHLQAIEQDFGRERPYYNAPRTLDLDLLLYGQNLIATERLIVPHPRTTERAFVLLPLLEIDPLVHVAGKGAAQDFVEKVADQGIRKLGL
jgi:2-amino-4-hydroxy-6-hydroxymethyldihydropteridine diphosphokinase